jgi:hypothetical protein
VSAELIDSLWVATALLLVLEGVIPFLSPSSFKRTLIQMVNLSDQQLRVIGLVSMVLGVILLYLVH